MIRINLLPEEYRRSTRTSPKVFAAILLVVIAVCGTFGWFGYVYFGDLGVLEVARSEAEELLTARKKRVAYYTSLVAEKNDYEERAKTIEGIAKSRTLWTEVVDQLIDTVNNEGDVDRHMAWFKSMSIKDGNTSKGPRVQMPGYVQSDNISRLSNFHDDFEQAPFYRWVASKSLPSGEIQIDAKKKPPESLFFQLQWDFLPAAEWEMER